MYWSLKQNVYLSIALTVTVVDTTSIATSDLIFPSSELQSEMTNVTLSNTIHIPFTSLSELATVSGKSILLKITYAEISKVNR